jgi:hypothetical protein
MADHDEGEEKDESPTMQCFALFAHGLHNFSLSRRSWAMASTAPSMDISVVHGRVKEGSPGGGLHVYIRLDPICERGEKPLALGEEITPGAPSVY